MKAQNLFGQGNSWTDQQGERTALLEKMPTEHHRGQRKPDTPVDGSPEWVRVYMETRPSPGPKVSSTTTHMTVTSSVRPGGEGRHLRWDTLAPM